MTDDVQWSGILRDVERKKSTRTKFSAVWRDREISVAGDLSVPELPLSELRRQDCNLRGLPLLKSAPPTRTDVAHTVREMQPGLPLRVVSSVSARSIQACAATVGPGATVGPIPHYSSTRHHV